VAHYLIHLYDYPAIADKGIEAARRYAKIAPDAPHALHMPSHIFTRVGYWNDSIASNLASARSAKKSSDFAEELHAMDYLVYAYLQLGQDEKARAVVDEMGTVTGFSETFIPGPYAEAVSPARYALERGDWKAAEGLNVRPSPLASRRSLILPARSERHGLVIPKRPSPMSRNSASFATSFAEQRTSIGRNRSISKPGSLPPGCSTPKARTPTR